MERKKAKSKKIFALPDRVVRILARRFTTFPIPSKAGDYREITMKASQESNSQMASESFAVISGFQRHYL